MTSCDVTLYDDAYRRFGGEFHLHLEGREKDERLLFFQHGDGSIMFFQNLGNHPPDYTASHPSRQYY
jgi:hypothetical protein